MNQSNNKVVRSSQTPLVSNPSYYVRSGTLRANKFTIDPFFKFNILSGNGNIDYGDGKGSLDKFDWLDLSSYSSGEVIISRADEGGGEIVNIGAGRPGARLLDAITLPNGNKVLFEGIERIQFKDKPIDLSIIPNDPFFPQQWNLHITGVHTAWRFTQGSANSVVIGVADTGLGTAPDGTIHPDLRETLGDPSNYQEDGDNGTIYYEHSHGTSVQSVIAANTNNGQGISGINWFSEILHNDIFPGSDPGDQTLATAIQEMIDSPERQGKRLVINISQVDGNKTELKQLEPIIASHQEDVLFVMASGNSNFNSLEFPSSFAINYENVISVGAVWGKADFGGYSKTPGTRINYLKPGEIGEQPDGRWGSSYGKGLTLMAPSEVIADDVWKRNVFLGLPKVGFDYNFKSNGTSHAAPHVTGIASLVWSVNPNLTAAQVKTILSQSAYQTSLNQEEYGSGIINADAAVRRALATLSTRQPIQITAPINGTKGNDILVGTDNDDTITGLDGKDRLVGNGGQDALNGGYGNDLLKGNLGEDSFFFDIASRFRRAIGIDKILDFKSLDKIVLDTTTFTKLHDKPFSFKSTNSLKQAQLSNSLITYVRPTGALYYNENGQRSGFGKGGQFADLANGQHLSRANFVVQE